jgi:large conductance mechanosensitive channel
MIREFKEFAARGNVVDLAVGIVIGAAFGVIVTSFVSDILMPPIGMALGHVDFADLKTVLKPATKVDGKDVPEVAIRYGAFLNTVINFLIIAFAVFLVVKAVNSMKRKQPEAPASAPVAKECPYCISTIPIKARRCPNCTSEIPATA